MLSYLQTFEPDELKRSGPQEYRTATHGSLVISNGKWNWFKGGFGGVSALDYLVKVRGISLAEAVQRLTGGRACPVPRQETRPPARKPFRLPKAARRPSRVLAYLQGRGIDGEILSRCIRDGSLYESFPHHNCVFVGREQTGKARFASLRGTRNSFKLDVPGSDKRFAFCLPSNSPGCQTVAVFESPIDALSGATLKKLEGGNWRDTHYLSLSGTSPLALIEFLRTHPNVGHAALCLDNDEAGKKGAARLEETIRQDSALSGQVKQIDRNPPPDQYGKDFNLYLQAVRAERKKKRVKQRVCR